MASLEGIISLGPWGGLGGDHWSYRTSRGITEIVLHVEGNIKSISFRDAGGQVSGTFGGRGNDPNDRGKEKKIEIQWPSEYLTSISGTYGSYKGLLVITSLSFITNLNPYGPFGTASTASGKPFSISTAHGVVVGFHGRCGYYLDTLGIFVIPRDNIERTISIGPWGGQGGSPWSYMTNRGIKRIVINTGLNIKSLSFRDTADLDSATFGGKNPNDIGERKTVLINWPSEHLISISGKYGNYASMLTIASLSFTTNRATYGPFGTGSGTSFTIPINNNTVVGFHGRAGHFLDAIGIFAKPETPI